VKLSSFRATSVGPLSFGGSPVVLFFYGADGSPSCTKQSCAFRDAYADFKAAGAQVFGISADDVERHAEFAEEQELPYQLLSDEGDEVRAEYGVGKDLFGLLKGRETFVIDKDGIVVSTFNNQFDVEAHVAKALAAL
jgi:peroxiredoxin Q/BCP